MTRHEFIILKTEQIKRKYQDLILSTYVICTNNRLLKNNRWEEASPYKIITTSK